MGSDSPVPGRREMPRGADCRPAAARPDDSHARAIDWLVRCYWATIYDHLRGKGYDRERAQDLTQGFFQEVVLERDLLEQVDPAKGSFRSFLFVVLCRYLIRVHKRENSRRHIPQSKLAPLDAVEPSRLPQITPEPPLADGADAAWLSETLTCVLKQIRAEYQEKGMSVHWYVFQAYVLQPIMDQTDRPPLKEVSERCGVDETKASNMIVTVQRRFGKLLSQHLRKLALSGEIATGEIEEIRRYLRESAQKQSGQRRRKVASN
jgi:DNA-directed RNA polymerase specialized sigma24 family protein